MWGVRNGWMAVVEGAQKVVLGVALAAVAKASRAARMNLVAPCMCMTPDFGQKGTAGVARVARTPPRRCPGAAELDVEVQSELDRRRPQPHRIQLALDLVFDPGLD